MTSTDNDLSLSLAELESGSYNEFYVISKEKIPDTEKWKHDPSTPLEKILYSFNKYEVNEDSCLHLLGFVLALTRLLLTLRVLTPGFCDSTVRIESRPSRFATKTLSPKRKYSLRAPDLRIAEILRLRKLVRNHRKTRLILSSSRFRESADSLLYPPIDLSLTLIP